MGISLSPFQPGQVVRDPNQQDPLSVLLAALTQGSELGVRGMEEQGRNKRTAQQEAGATARSELQHEADMANVDLRRKEYDFKIAEQKSEQARLKLRGEALKQLLPFAQATGQGQQILDAMGPQLGLTAPTTAAPAPGIASGTPPSAGGAAEPPRDIVSALLGMPPEIIGSVLEELPKIAELRKQGTRDAITRKYQPAPNETMPAMVDRLKRMSADFATAGDHAMVASLASDIGVLEGPTRAESYEWFLSKDGKSTVYLPKEEGSRLRLGKPLSTTGFGFGAAGPLGAMRAMSGIAGMEDADRKMRQYEIMVASGQADLTDKDYFQGQISSLYNNMAKEAGIAGHIVPFFGTAAGTQMLERLNKSNPAYAQYLQAASQWALEESLLSNRPSDFRTKMDEFISAVKPGSKPPIIHDLWKSRSVRLKGYQAGLPALQRMFDRVANMPGVSTEVITPP